MLIACDISIFHISCVSCS